MKYLFYSNGFPEVNAFFAWDINTNDKTNNATPKNKST